MDEQPIYPMTTAVPLMAEPKKKKNILFVALMVLAVLVLAGLCYVVYAYTPLGTRLQTIWSIATMPAELKQATFVADGASGTTLYRIQGYSYIAEPLDGILVSTEQEASGRADIIYKDLVYSVRVNGKTVYATSSPLLGVSLSKDGTRAVVSTLLSQRNVVLGHAYTASPNVQPARWTIVLIDIGGAPATAHVIGQGITPVALDATHFLHLSSLGLVATDLQKGNDTVLVPETLPATMPATLSSPDRTQYAWYSVGTKAITVYTIAPASAQKSATFTDVNHKTSFALSNDAFYTVRIAGGATQIQKQGFSGGANPVVASTPGNLRITRLLIGSL